MRRTTRRSSRVGHPRSWTTSSGRLRCSGVVRCFLNPGSPGNVRFALASCLSTVCREVDVELVRDWELGHSLYWGKVGHYKVAATACRLSSNTNLDTLLNANLETIAVSDQSISSGNLSAERPASWCVSFPREADVRLDGPHGCARRHA